MSSSKSSFSSEVVAGDVTSLSSAALNELLATVIGMPSNQKCIFYVNKVGDQVGNVRGIKLGYDQQFSRVVV